MSDAPSICCPVATPKRRSARKGLLGWLVLWRQRRALSRLDAHLLRDIGLTGALAGEEAARPFWDAPAHWRS